MPSALDIVLFIALASYSSLLALVSWRLCAHLIPYTPPIYTTRKLFHILIWMYAALQSASLLLQINSSLDPCKKSSYCCHLAAVWAEVAAISLVLILWSKTLLSREKAHSEILPLVILCDGAFLGYIIACIVDLATTSQSWEDWLITSKVYKHLLLVEPCALLFNGVGILWYGSQIRARLIEHPSWTPLPPERKRLSLQRLYGTIFLCCSCFSMRAAFLIYGFTRCDSGDAGMSMAVWLIFSNFIPTIIPALCVMYAMRRPDVNEKNLPIQANNPYTRTPTWVGLSWGTDTSLTAYTQALLRPEIEEERESNARPQSTDFYS